MLWIGYGQAGAKIVDALMGMDKKRYAAIVINTEGLDLAGLKNIDEKILIGKYRQKGRGVGANIDLSEEMAQKSLSQMMDRIARASRKLDPEAYCIVAGMAGGTGAGGGHILAKEIRDIYHKPVYGLAVLPSTVGMASDKEALCIANTLRSTESWRANFDNTLLVDNGQYEMHEEISETGEPVEKMYQRINEDIAARLTILLGAGEAKHPPQEVFGSSEVIATFGQGGGFSTIGHRSEKIRLKSRFWAKGVKPDEKRLEEIIKESTDESMLTFACDVSGAKAAGLVVYGRPEHLFTQAIIAGKGHLEQKLKVGEVRYGDYPDKGSTEIGAVTLVSGLTDLPRLNQMKTRLQELK
ncbi:MAG: hypothetical protein ACLFVK_05025 [Dehalococcoidia bacterium]